MFYTCRRRRCLYWCKCGYSIESGQVTKAAPPPTPPSSKPNQLPKPWEVQTAQSVSDAVAELLEEVLSRYVQPWYSMISLEPQFINECRASLRQGAANLYARILRSPWPSLMSSTVPRLISQLTFFTAQDDKDTNVLRALPKDVLHPAVKSIHLEDGYWRQWSAKITAKLFPHLSSTASQVLNVILSSNVLIPSLDLACSERIMLKVLISIHALIVKQIAGAIFNTQKNEKIWTQASGQATSRCSILLYEFGTRRRVYDGKSLFAISNRSLIDDQGKLLINFVLNLIFEDILYNFKKWLQSANAVPLLNYVHAFEDFNRRFFAKAELTAAEIDAFHRELSQIIDGYFTAESSSRIPVKSKIHQGYSKII